MGSIGSRGQKRNVSVFVSVRLIGSRAFMLPRRSAITLALVQIVPHGLETNPPPRKPAKPATGLDAPANGWRKQRCTAKNATEPAAEYELCLMVKCTLSGNSKTVSWVSTAKVG